MEETSSARAWQVCRPLHELAVAVAGAGTSERLQALHMEVVPGSSQGPKYVLLAATHTRLFVFTAVGGLHKLFASQVRDCTRPCSRRRRTCNR